MDYLKEDYSVKGSATAKRSNSVISVKRKTSFVSLSRRKPTFGSGSHSASASPQRSENQKSPKGDKKLKNLVREERASSKWYAYTPVPFRADEKTASHVDIPKVTCLPNSKELSLIVYTFVRVCVAPSYDVLKSSIYDGYCCIWSALKKRKSRNSRDLLAYDYRLIIELTVVVLSQ